MKTATPHGGGRVDVHRSAGVISSADGMDVGDFMAVYAIGTPSIRRRRRISSVVNDGADGRRRLTPTLRASCWLYEFR